MSFEADLLVDRRRLKNRLLRWQMVVVVVALIAIVAVAPHPKGFATHGAHISRLTVDGVIKDDPKRIEDVEKLAKDNAVKALIVDIDSPGGSVSGGESLHDALLHVAAVKPVVAVMQGTAASAAYMIALPAKRIFARESTLTGSIGVLLETGEASGLLKSVGVNAEQITSGPLKGQPSFIAPLSDPGRAYLHDLVMDLFDQFVTMVADERHIAKPTVLSLADGRAYTGRQALKIGLIDQIGSDKEAIDWLASHDHIDKNLPIVKMEPPPSAMPPWLHRIVGSSVSGFLTDYFPGLAGALFGQQSMAGIHSVWAIW